MCTSLVVVFVFVFVCVCETLSFQSIVRPFWKAEGSIINMNAILLLMFGVLCTCVATNSEPSGCSMLKNCQRLRKVTEFKTAHKDEDFNHQRGGSEEFKICFENASSRSI